MASSISPLLTRIWRGKTKERPKLNKEEQKKIPFKKKVF